MKKQLITKPLIMLLILTWLLPVQDLYGYKNVYKLEFEGFTLGMSVREAINNLKNNGYIETNSSGEIGILHYKVSSELKDDIPITSINGKRFDSSLFSIFLANKEMVTYYLEKEYKTNIEITKLKKEYIEIFGKPDAYRDAEAPNKTSGSFGMIWGGEPEEGYFEPKFPHVKVKCSYERVKNSLSIKESLRIMDI